MTPRHQIFADALLRGATQTAAALEAGYAESRAHVTGSELVRNSKIVAYIAEQRQKAADGAELSVEWVLLALTETYASARTESQHATAHATAVSIGKHLGMWPNKLVITDADREAAHVAAEKLGLNEADVLAEVERELKEAR